MIIHSYQPTSLIDYPGQVAAVIFLQGCPWRCPFCHNYRLVSRCCRHPVSIDDLLTFLRRRPLLDGVVISGGEPTVHADLPELILRIRELGLNVKLDTNGYDPAALYPLLEEGMVDYIAMDVKAPIDRYDRLAGVRVNPGALLESIQLIRQSATPGEFRTTFVPELMDLHDLLEIARTIAGPKPYYLQEFIAANALSSALRDSDRPSPGPQTFAHYRDRLHPITPTFLRLGKHALHLPEPLNP